MFGEHPRTHRDSSAERPREKPRHASSERTCLHYDSCDQPRYERSHLRDSSAKNQVDQESRAYRQKKIRSLVFRRAGKLVGHGIFRPAEADTVRCDDILCVTPTQSIRLLFQKKDNLLVINLTFSLTFQRTLSSTD